MSIEGCEMYLLWKKGMNGKLTVSRSGLKKFVDDLLPEGYVCMDINLLSETDEVTVILSLPELHSSVEMELVRNKVVKALDDMGFEIRFSWARAQSRRWFPFALPDFHSPLFWGGALALLAALFSLGLKGIFFVAASGLAGVIVASAVNYFDGTGSLRNVLKSLWR